MTQRTTIRDYLDVTTTEADDFGVEVRTLFPSLDVLWGSGTGSSQADKRYEDIGVTLTTASTRNLDLRSLTDHRGAALSFVEVRGIWVRCRDFALTFAKGAANGWTALGAAWTITPPAGTWMRILNPTDAKLPTTATDKVIDISNASGSTATYDLLIVGVSA